MADELGNAQDYTLMTLAALLVVRSTNWSDVDNDESITTPGIEVRWASPSDFVFF